jgi:hypothetical protein
MRGGQKALFCITSPFAGYSAAFFRSRTLLICIKRSSAQGLAKVDLQQEDLV